MTSHSATPGYFTRYENFAFERTDGGVLTLRFHTNGGPITFTGQTHEDLPRALEEIALDQNNRALLLTSTGIALWLPSMGQASATSSCFGARHVW